jgi:hypothetical protein
LTEIFPLFRADAGGTRAAWSARVTHTDRAFRSFARARPRSVVALLRLVGPSLVDVDEAEIVALSDPNVDVPPHPRETDDVTIRPFSLILARSFSLGDAQRDAILTQHDVEILRAWFRRMVTGTSVAEAIE